MKNNYKDVELLIHDLINKFIASHGGNAEDLLSLCNEKYVDVFKLYDPKKGAKFSSWLYTILWRHMLRYNNQEINKKRYRKEINLETIPKKTYQKDFLSELYIMLSDDAKCVCEVLIDLSPELLQTYKDSGQYIRKTRRAIKNLFLDIGWSESRIRLAFKEIRLTLVMN